MFNSHFEQLAFANAIVDKTASELKELLIKLASEIEQLPPFPGAMFTYGIIQLGSNAISALALATIALSFCSVKQESKVFNECVEDIQATGKSSSNAVRFCNGGR